MTKPKRSLAVAAEAESELRAPTNAEAKAAAEAKERQASRPARARITAKQGSSPEALEIGPAHNDKVGWAAQFTDTFGTRSNAFADQALVRIISVLQTRAAIPSERALNSALALMGAIAPRDELEAAIGEQIVGAHHLSMNLMHWAQTSDTVPKVEAYINMATKVSRTMAAHVDTLAKLRSGGKQTHEVRYVYVNGPAVIGDHTQAVFADAGAHTHGGAGEKPGQSQAQIGYAPGAPVPEMRGEDAERTALQGPRGEGAPQMPDARCTSGSTDREGERPLPDRPLDEGTAGGAGAGPARVGDRGDR